MTKSLMRKILTLYLAVALGPKISSGDDGNEDKNSGYGVDVSFPIHHRVSTNYDYLPHNQNPSLPVPKHLEGQPLQVLGHRHQVYLDHLDGCRKSPSTNVAQECDKYDYERMLMNKRQPQSIVNMTKTGFKKVRAPDRLRELLKEFWDKNQLAEQKVENWGDGNVYMNHWVQPTTLLSVEDNGLRGAGYRLKREIWAALSALMEEWTQQELQPSSMYGIRVYHEGAVMLPHVDRLPLVASAIINVAQDTDEAWPTEIYDHDGWAHNVTLDPFEMLLFESASCLHGHPFPLKGRYYASIFVHFEPTGKSLGLDDTGFYYLKDGSKSKRQRELDMEYEQRSKDGHGGQTASFNGKLPPYIIRESPEEANWLQYHPEGWMPSEDALPPDAHVAAKKGILSDLELELEEHGNKVLTERDEHGWQVLHQGVAGGNADVVEFLIERGAEINARTHGGYGETPLRIAEKRHGENSLIVQYLKRKGALSIGPEL